MLGAAGYGAYSFALATAGILSVPALFGFDALFVREVAGYLARRQWALLNGILRFGNRLVLLSAIGLAAAAGGAAWAASPWLDPDLLTPLGIALLSLPFLAVSRVQQATLIALRRVVSAQVPRAADDAAPFLTLVGGAVILAGEARLSRLLAFMVKDRGRGGKILQYATTCTLRAGNAPQRHLHFGRGLWDSSLAGQAALGLP